GCFRPVGIGQRPGGDLRGSHAERPADPGAVGMEADESAPVEGEPAVDVLVNAHHPDDGSLVVLPGLLLGAGEVGLDRCDISLSAGHVGMSASTQLAVLAAAAPDDDRFRVVLLTETATLGLR